MFRTEDTICAPATSVGAGAISIIRVSGKDTLAVADRVISLRRGDIVSAPGYSLRFGTIEGIDDVLVSIFRAPHSYTGEDSVEISCHASSFVVRRILELLVEAGARMADAGEFTRRAFVNGKLDLAQAEAVADVIAADSEAAHRIAMNQLRGAYSSELRGLRDRLVELASLLELELDFSEEDVEFADRGRLADLLGQTLAHVRRLASSFRAGNAVKNGVPVAIVGAVNAGKSTLLNALVGDERAIVSDIAGTTRDTVEEVISIDGISFRFIDTAGIRETDEAIEKIGIARSLDALAKADVVIGLVDGSGAAETRLQAARELAERVSEGQTFILAVNKSDLMQAASAMATEALPCRGSLVDAGCLSARSGEGVEKLRTLLAESQKDRFGASSGTLVTSMRHYEALVRAAAALEAVQDGMALCAPTDLLAEDMRSAIHEINTIFGDSAIGTEDLLGSIFSRFCIGK